MIERFLFAERERLDFDAAHRPALLALLGVRARRHGPPAFGFGEIDQDLFIDSIGVAVQGELVLIESVADDFDDGDAVVMVLTAAGDSFSCDQR